MRRAQVDEAERLAAYYAEHGESDFLLRVEAALEPEWTTTPELARAADVSLSYAHKALRYLELEGRAETRAKRHGRRLWRSTT